MSMHRLAAIVAAAIAIAVALVPASASAQPGADIERLADAITICNRITPLQMEEAAGPELSACHDAGRAIFAAARTLPLADQERLGLAFAAVVNAAPVPGPLDAPVPPAIDALADLFRNASYRQCWRGAAAPTLEGCTAAVRIMAIASQVFPADVVETVAIDICIASQGRPAWQQAVLAVVDELVAREAGGGDPIMRANIDPVAELRAKCGIVHATLDRG